MSENKTRELWGAWDDAVASGNLDGARDLAAKLLAILGDTRSWASRRAWETSPRWSEGQREGFEAWCDDQALRPRLVRSYTAAKAARWLDAPQAAGLLAELYVYLRASRSMCATVRKALRDSKKIPRIADRMEKGLGYLRNHEDWLAESLERLDYELPGGDDLAAAFCTLITKSTDEAEANEQTAGGE